LKWLKPSPTGDVLTMARHVFAGGKRIATFEPQGGVFGYRLKPKRRDDLAKTAEMAFLWPLQEDRAPDRQASHRLIAARSQPAGSLRSEPFLESALFVLMDRGKCSCAVRDRFVDSRSLGHP
jgi:hypothetical protein